jgi:hypothetical protein
VGIVLVALFEMLPSRHQHINPKTISTKSNLISLELAIAEYEIHTGKYPDPEMGLISLIEDPGIEKWDGPYVYKSRLPKDGWGNDFIYRLDNNIPSISSAGPDGKAGTDDDIESDHKYLSTAPAEEDKQPIEPDA